jgi:hypothetical protein
MYVIPLFPIAIRVLTATAREGELENVCDGLGGGGAVVFTASEPAGPLVYLTSVLATSCRDLLSAVLTTVLMV